jgi:hypothetical protein
MRFIALACLALVSNVGSAADLDRAAISTATRDLGKQFDLLQELFGTNDQLSRINGLFQQTLGVQTALAEFRQNVYANASAEQLAIGFDTLDRKLSDVLAETQFLEKDLPALRLVCNRLRLAGHELHFAVFGGSASSERQGEKLVRQTLAERALVESLANNVSWMFSGREGASGWKDDLTAVGASLAALQAVVEKKGATPDEIKDQFLQADKSWAKIVQRFTDARPQDKMMLRSFVVMADQGLGRLAPLAGVKDRRAPLSDRTSD